VTVDGAIIAVVFRVAVIVKVEGEHCCGYVQPLLAVCSNGIEGNCQDDSYLGKFRSFRAEDVADEDTFSTTPDLRVDVSSNIVGSSGCEMVLVTTMVTTTSGQGV
jgi:hypothetical protein